MRPRLTLLVMASLLGLLHVAGDPRAGQEDTPDGLPDVYRLEADDTLRALSERRYGSPHYSKIVKIYNRVEDPKTLRPGDNIRIPELMAILEEEGLTRVMGSEVSGILNARSRYMAVEEQLWALRSGTRRGIVVEIPAEIEQALLRAAKEAETAAAGFGILKPGVRQVPRSLIGQLMQSATNLRRIATGWSDGYGYDLDMVHQRLALAMYYGIIWARNGFE